MAEQWYFMENGQQQGPISDIELGRFAATGRIAPATMVWQQGSPQWIPAARLNGLFRSEPATPPPPPAGSAPPPPPVSGGAGREGGMMSSYSQVPWHRRSRTNNWLLALGFLPLWLLPEFGPLGLLLGLAAMPLLWWGCFNAMTGKVYRKTTDKEGNLKTWGRGERFVTLVILAFQLLILVLHIR